MERIGVRQLRQHASRYLARVSAGETLEVTARGRLVARLVPPDRGVTVRERLVAAGTVIPAPVRWRLPEPIPAHAGEPASGEVLEELRAERV